MKISALLDSGADAPKLGRIWLLGAATGFSPGNAELVVELDPADDLTVPPQAAEIAVAAREGWFDSLAAVLGAEPARALPAWVFASDIGTAAMAARGGIGVVIPQLDDADSAAEWVEEYDAELAAASARPVGAAINAACAAIAQLPSDLDAAVGLIERYRQAGVDEVALQGVALADAELVAALVAEFDDDEVRADSAARAERRAPAIAAMRERAKVGAAEPVRRKDASRFALMIKRNQEAAARRLSDRQLEVIVGNRLGVRILMATMARRFRPDRAGGFAGSIEFRLGTRRGEEIWTLDCDTERAIARKGEDPEAKLHVAAELADFLRVGTGEIAAPAAVLGGKLHIRGDFGLALKLGEMFDGPRIGHGPQN